MKKRFIEESVIGLLKETGLDTKVAEWGRDIGDATHYNWKAEFGGMAGKSTPNWVPLQPGTANEPRPA